MNQIDWHQSGDETLDKILEVTNQLVKLAHNGDFIFRGESECYEEVSSSLYRQCSDADPSGSFDVEAIQKDILNRAKAYTNEADDLEILSQLQHYGGRTNLIDFTTDCLIALFFACYAAPGKDGRVILLQKRGSLDPYIKEPRRTANRVIAQHSVFVLPPSGVIESFDVEPVPKVM